MVWANGISGSEAAVSQFSTSTAVYQHESAVRLLYVTGTICSRTGRTSRGTAGNPKKLKTPYKDNSAKQLSCCQLGSRQNTSSRSARSYYGRKIAIFDSDIRAVSVGSSEGNHREIYVYCRVRIEISSCPDCTAEASDNA